MLKSVKWMILGGVLLFMFSSGCTAIKSFPMTARPGDTVSLALGFDPWLARHKMSRADTIVTIEKDDQSYTAVITETSTPPLRGVFQLYPDPNSKLANFTGYWLNTPALNYGDPYQTVVVFDLPSDITPGNYTMIISSTHTADWTYGIEIVSGTGSSNPFTDYTGVDRDITLLERGPVVSVALDAGYSIGALSMVIDFDDGTVAPSDFNVLLPRLVQGSGTFQSSQRMLQWDVGPDSVGFPTAGDLLKVNIICPFGLDSNNLKFDILYPEGSPDPALTILSQQVYDINGSEISGVGATLDIN